MTVPSAAHRAVALVVAICGLSTVVTLGPSGPAATAQSLRDQIPIVAGTALEVQGARLCTAGAVLRSTSLLSRARPIANATRYVVTAGHCGNVGETVKVGDSAAGTVIWASLTYDLALVKIPPSTAQRPVCSGASQLHHCTIPPATPRAVGRIILNRGSTQRAVPVPGFGIAGVGERFCTSGAVSFANCTFEIASVDPSWLSPGELAAHTTSGFTLGPGDSGGPVANISGRLYGIILSAGTEDHEGIIGYIPMSTIFHDLRYDYELAPA